MTRDQLVEFGMRFLDHGGYTDALGGMEWAHRIHEAGGPEAPRCQLEQLVDEVPAAMEDGIHHSSIRELAMTAAHADH